MTQDTIRRGSVGTTTEGIGSRTTAHLNLTVTLADAWAAEHARLIAGAPSVPDDAMKRAKARTAERRVYEREMLGDMPFSNQNLIGE